MNTVPQDGRPTLQVVRGEPTREEVAALVAVVAARAAAAPQPRATTRRWSDRGTLLRRPLRPGPGAWRASTRNR